MKPKIPKTGKIGSLAKNIGKETNRDVVQEIMHDVAQFQSASSRAEKAEWIKEVIERLARHVGEEKSVIIMENCGRDCCQDCRREHAKFKTLMSESKSIEEFLNKVSMGGINYKLKDKNTIIGEYNKCYCFLVKQTKKPFQNTFSVIEYLGRYSHKVAISNHRIVQLDNQNNRVSFSLKNYRNNGKKQVLTLDQKEFIRRFSLHILPKGFTRIRHYGTLSGTWKKKHLKKLQNQLLKGKNKIKKEIKSLLHVCPSCKKGTLRTILAFNKYHPPPMKWIEQLKNQTQND
jgi:hypothetical protein